MLAADPTYASGVRFAKSIVLTTVVAASACGTRGYSGPSCDPCIDASDDLRGDVELSEATTYDGSTCQETCGVFASGASSGPYACDVLGKCVQCIQDQGCATFGGRAPACLPDETCGCNANSQCTGQGPGTQCLLDAGVCGCATSADCPDPRLPVCNASSPDGARCVECLSDADCTDPDARACSGNFCLPCVTSMDCATNGSGPTCIVGEVTCGCSVDADCAGRAADVRRRCRVPVQVVRVQFGSRLRWELRGACLRQPAFPDACGLWIRFRRRLAPVRVHDGRRLRGRLNMQNDLHRRRLRVDAFPVPTFYPGEGMG